MQRAFRGLIAVGFILAGGAAEAQNAGFAIDRYEPTAPGEWSFAVDHPWYSRTRYLAAGLTFDYAHNPLVFGTRDASGRFTETASVISNQWVGHVDVAGSYFDRVTASASLPVVLGESGTATSGVSPNSGAAGDPRVGLVGRIYGQDEADPISLHLGCVLWIPVGGHGSHAADAGVRAAPKLILAGLIHRFRWSLVPSFVYRPLAVVGTMPSGSGNSVGSEVRLGGAVAYADTRRRFSIGPEAIVGTVVTGGNGFKKDFTSFEILLGGQYHVQSVVQLGVAVGVGTLREPGTPDVRLLARAAYAPVRKSAEPAAPIEVGPRDRDRDGVADADDVCPDQPRGEHPDPKRPGCPDGDADRDGIYDSQDQCPQIAAGPHPDPKRPGCPDRDTDGDGVFDAQDRCPEVAAGLHPDPQQLGCPLADRDHDNVPDDVDACPDQPGAPHPDPSKNGCPGLVQIKDDKIVILSPVFFATGKDRILPRSFPVLIAVAKALEAEPEIKSISIDGHTDDRGRPERNQDLSQRRASSVLRFLIEHGVKAERLEAHGYGPSRPLTTNKTSLGRAANRRVEFRIIGSARESASAPESR